jgi:signal transduction histidine kinase
LIKGRISQYAKDKFHSLYFRLIWVIVVGALIASGCYIIARFVSNYYINNYYTDENNKVEREERYIDDLREYVSEKKMTSSDTGELAKWAQNHRYVYLLIYKDDELFFTSDMLPEEDDKQDDLIGGVDGDTLGSGSGITVDYPTREELLEYAKENDLYPIELSDGTIFASIAEFTEYLYYDLANILSLGIAMLVLAAIIINYFRTIIARIKRLEADVTLVSEGDMNHEIRAGGYDEISKLSVNIENMRNSILENLKKEREAREANKELITAMSHDIRTPLTVLLGYLDIMKESTADDEQLHGYVTASENTAMRLKQLSDDMFKYSLAFGSSEEGIQLEEYNAWMLLEQLLAEHILLLRESGYDVVGELSGDELDSEKIMRTDAQNLMRIIDNVFSNIYKYADKGRPVSITVKNENDRLVLIEFENYVSKVASHAESNGIGLKTCSRLGKLIADGFEFGLTDDVFKVSILIAIYDPKK